MNERITKQEIKALNDLALRLRTDTSLQALLLQLIKDGQVLLTRECLEAIAKRL